VISVDGSWHFSSGPGTRQSRNIARDPRCVISVATHPFDLVVEGRWIVTHEHHSFPLAVSSTAG